MATSSTIAYGPTYRANLESFIGAKVGPREWRCIASDCYLTPTSDTYQLPDGRIVHIVNKVFSDVVYIFPTFLEWDAAQRARAYPDPETGR